MRVFISWSGSKSRKFAEQLREWIPLVIQSAKPYFSPEDIEKGARWSSEISEELSSSEIGIICLTRDNIHSDWILFESGALSKSLDKSHVCPILFGLGNADIDGPLKQFQTTSFNKADFFKLINLINSKSNENKLAPKILERSFDLCWPDFESKINTILSEKNDHADDDKPIRSDREILEELLDISRNSFSRISRNNVTIPSIVANDLAKYFLLISDQQKSNEGDYQDALDILSKLKKPIFYILSKNSSNSLEVRELMDKIADFKFRNECKEDNEEEITELDTKSEKNIDRIRTLMEEAIKISK